MYSQRSFFVIKFYTQKIIQHATTALEALHTLDKKIVFFPKIKTLFSFYEFIVEQRDDKCNLD